jgi:chromosome segregation ATPase
VASLGFLVMGLLFGLAMALVLGAFLVLLQTAENRALLRAGRLPILHLLGLRHEPPPEKRPDLEPRLRALQEELRVTQRLVDQARVEREARQAEQRQRDEELATLRAQLAERTARCEELAAVVAGEQDRARGLEEQVSTRSDELSRANMTLKDLRTELDVVQSGDSVTASQLERLRQERDALAALVGKLRQALAAARAGATGPPPRL